VLRSILTR
jgi:roadblock/LC7 domain-containing protein